MRRPGGARCEARSASRPFAPILLGLVLATCAEPARDDPAAATADTATVSEASTADRDLDHRVEILFIRPDGTETNAYATQPQVLSRPRTADTGGAVRDDSPKPVLDSLVPDRAARGTGPVTVLLGVSGREDTVRVRTFEGPSYTYPVERTADGRQRFRLPAELLAKPTHLTVGLSRNPATALPFLVFDPDLPPIGRDSVITGVEYEGSSLVVSVARPDTASVVLGRGATPVLTLATEVRSPGVLVAYLPAWHLGADDFFLATLAADGATLSAPFSIPSWLTELDPTTRDVEPRPSFIDLCPNWTIGDNYDPGDVALTGIEIHGSWRFDIRGVGLQEGLRVILRSRDLSGRIVHERVGRLGVPRFVHPDPPEPSDCFPGPRVREQIAPVELASERLVR